MANTKVIWHGSPVILGKPIFGKDKPYNDYGRGFYCTENSELAKEWACSDKADGYANQYGIELDGLRILALSSEQSHSELAGYTYGQSPYKALHFRSNRGFEVSAR